MAQCLHAREHVRTCVLKIERRADQTLDVCATASNCVRRKRRCGVTKWHDINYQGVMAKAPPRPGDSENAVATAKFAVSQGPRE